MAEPPNKKRKLSDRTPLYESYNPYSIMPDYSLKEFQLHYNALCKKLMNENDDIHNNDNNGNDDQIDDYCNIEHISYKQDYIIYYFLRHNVYKYNKNIQCLFLLKSIKPFIGKYISIYFLIANHKYSMKLLWPNYEYSLNKCINKISLLYPITLILDEYGYLRKIIGIYNRKKNIQKPSFLVEYNYNCRKLHILGAFVYEQLQLIEKSNNNNTKKCTFLIEKWYLKQKKENIYYVATHQSDKAIIEIFNNKIDAKQRYNTLTLNWAKVLIECGDITHKYGNQHWWLVGIGKIYFDYLNEMRNEYKNNDYELMPNLNDLIDCS